MPTSDAFGWFFEDNYFDLLPGESKVVKILGTHSAGRITAKAWYSPHATTVDWQRSSGVQTAAARRPLNVPPLEK